MLRKVILIQDVERRNSWTVSVRDDMDEGSIGEVMLELWRKCDLKLFDMDFDDREPIVEFADAPPEEEAQFILTECGRVDKVTMLTAFTTTQLRQELDRRGAEDGGMSGG